MIGRSLARISGGGGNHRRRAMTSSIPTTLDRDVCIGARCRQRFPYVCFSARESSLFPFVGQFSPGEQRASRIFASVGTLMTSLYIAFCRAQGSVETVVCDPVLTPCRPHFSSAALLVDGCLCVTPEPHVAGVV